MYRTPLAALMAAMALSACASGPTVSSDTTPGANLAAYHTYAWANTAPPAGMNPVAFERMRQGIDGALNAKGYTQGQPGDLTLILTVGKRDVTDVNTWGRYGLQGEVYQYTQGKMSLDAFDSKTRQPLWHGQATQTINPNQADPAVIDAAVSGVMTKFPPRG